MLHQLQILETDAYKACVLSCQRQARAPIAMLRKRMESTHPTFSVWNAFSSRYESGDSPVTCAHTITQCLGVFMCDFN